MGAKNNDDSNGCFSAIIIAIGGALYALYLLVEEIGIYWTIGIVAGIIIIYLLIRYLINRKRRKEELREIIRQKEERIQRIQYIKENIGDASKSDKYRYLKEFIRLFRGDGFKSEAPFIKQQLIEAINCGYFSIYQDIEYAKNFDEYIGEQDSFSDVYNEIYKQFGMYIESLTFSNYGKFEMIKDQINELRGKVQTSILLEKLHAKENEILEQYNGKYPYADKKCYYNVTGLVVNKRGRTNVYYDIDNGIKTEFYVFDDVIEIQNLNGISQINIQDIFKTEVYNDSVLLLYLSSGYIMSFYFDYEHKRTYLTKIIDKLKNKKPKTDTDLQQQVTPKDWLKVINEQLSEKTNGSLHSFQKEAEILWWKVGNDTGVWLRLGDWNNYKKLYFAFWSNYNNEQYHNYRYDNDKNKEFLKLYKVSSTMDFATFTDLLNGKQIPSEKIEMFVNEIVEFYTNGSLNGKNITSIIDECNK